MQDFHKKFEMQANLVSWNPCNRSQFVTYSKDRLQLLEFYNEQGVGCGLADRNVRQVKTWDAPQVSCIDWRPPVDGPLLAYGTSVGTVHLVNAHSGDEVSECTSIAPQGSMVNGPMDYNSWID